MCPYGSLGIYLEAELTERAGGIVGGEVDGAHSGGVGLTGVDYGYGYYQILAGFYDLTALNTDCCTFHWLYIAENKVGITGILYNDFLLVDLSRCFLAKIHVGGFNPYYRLGLILVGGELFYANSVYGNRHLTLRAISHYPYSVTSHSKVVFSFRDIISDTYAYNLLGADAFRAFYAHSVAVTCGFCG